MTRRPPAVAGQFYLANPKRLRHAVTGYIDDAGVEPAPERVVAIMAPHAGHEYSGPTAGYAYARVRGKQPKRVILAGCSHRYPVATASVYERGAFDTPLGPFPIDEAFASELAGELKSRGTEPHQFEHSLEVQLPFFEVAFGKVPIVPVLFGGPGGSWHTQVGEKLAGMLDEGDLVVASTDLSHFLTEEQANRIDRHTLDAVLTQDIAALTEALRDGTCSMCAGAAVLMAMGFALARGATAWSLLDYRTSGSATGDYDRVVGYGAISMERAA